MSRARAILEQLEMVNGIRVSMNPTRVQRLKADLNFEALLLKYTPPPLKHTKSFSVIPLRMLVHLPSQDIFFWEASQEIHYRMARALGVITTECVFGEAVWSNQESENGKWQWWFYGGETLPAKSRSAFQKCVEKVKGGLS